MNVALSSLLLNCLEYKDLWTYLRVGHLSYGTAGFRVRPRTCTADFRFRDDPSASSTVFGLV